VGDGNWFKLGEDLKFLFVLNAVFTAIFRERMSTYWKRNENVGWENLGAVYCLAVLGFSVKTKCGWAPI
jgi:hypothetical protein